jgi:two-component system response regulator FixJ
MKVHPATVFIVDDDEAVRGSLKLLLKSLNMSAEAFASAQEFLAAFDPRRGGCLVLDIRMPGMSGLELQEELNARGAMLPIIFITGHGERLRSLIDELTPREQQVLYLVTQGRANKVIAADLGLSQRTVEIHRAHVMEKMGANSLAHLVRMVIDTGRTEPPPTR